MLAKLFLLQKQITPFASFSVTRFLLLKKLFIYLAVLGLSYDVWGLLSICGAWAYLPYGMWDLRSLTSDGTRVPCIGGGFLTTGPPGKPPLQCSWLENSMDRGAWRTTVHGITKSQTQLSD